MGIPDAIVMAVYFAAMIGVGLRYARSMRSPTDYFAGGKQVPWWLGGVSLAMSYVSAFSIVVYAGMGYEFGLVALTLYWASVPAILLTTWLFARRWRRAGVITPMGFLEKRFSGAIQQLFAWSGIPLTIVDESLKVVAIATFVSGATQIPVWAAMCTIGLTIVAYAALGGLWAVVVTDLIQFVLVTVIVILLAPLSWQAAGGWNALHASLPRDMFLLVREPFGWPYVVAFFLLIAVSMSGNWSLIQKFYSVQSDRDARKVGWLAGAFFFLLPPFWILTGMMARGFIAPNGIDPQSIYSRVGSALLPPGMLGLAMAALLAATMSVLSSGYNVISAVLTMDVYKNRFRPQASRREVIVVGRALTIAVGTVVLMLSLLVAYLHWAMYRTMVVAFSVLLPPTVLPMLAGLLSRRLSASGALAGYMTGLGMGFALLVVRWRLQPPPYGLFDALSLTLPIVATALTLLAAGKLSPEKGASAATTGEFLDALDRPAPAERQAATSPIVIAGSIIAFMGLTLAGIGAGLFARAAKSMITVHVALAFLLIGLVMVLVPKRSSGVAYQGRESGVV